MATPMHVFAEIAARYGIDPEDDDAVDRFYETAAEELPPEEQQKIFDELLERDGEPRKGPAQPREYTTGATTPKLADCRSPDEDESDV